MGGVSGAKRAADRFDDAFDVAEDVVVPEAQNTKTFAVEPVRAFDIFLRTVRMLSAINLDDEPSFKANEIDDEASDRRLAAEAMAIELPKAQVAP